MNNFEIIRKVKINSFLKITTFDSCEVSVIAKCKGQNHCFHRSATTSKRATREMEITISLHFDTYFEFSAPHHIDFSLN